MRGQQWKIANFPDNENSLSPPLSLFANSIRLDFAAEDHDRGNPSPLYDSCELLLSEVCQTREHPFHYIHLFIHLPRAKMEKKKNTRILTWKEISWLIR